MEPRQAAVPKRDFVVETDELHEHVADEHNQVSYITSLVLCRHDLDFGHWRAYPLCKDLAGR